MVALFAGVRVRRVIVESPKAVAPSRSWLPLSNQSNMLSYLGDSSTVGASAVLACRLSVVAGKRSSPHLPVQQSLVPSGSRLGIRLSHPSCFRYLRPPRSLEDPLQYARPFSLIIVSACRRRDGASVLTGKSALPPVPARGFERALLAIGVSSCLLHSLRAHVLLPLNCSRLRIMLLFVLLLDSVCGTRP
jgi:hypothetical protein